MQILYYLLLLVLAVSALIALLLASGVLHISVHDMSNPDDLPDEIREMLNDEEEQNERENDEEEKK